MRRGTALGFVMLLVALVVTVLLVARSWKAVAPHAIQVTGDAEPGVGVRYQEHGEQEAGDALRRGDLPDLRQMQRSTDAHADQVQQALTEVE